MKPAPRVPPAVIRVARAVRRLRAMHGIACLALRRQALRRSAC